VLSNVVFNINTRKRIVGVEFLDASSFFRKLGINQQELGDMVDAEFEVDVKNVNIYHPGSH